MKRTYTPARKKLILIVDDDQVAVHTYREKFLSNGFKVEVASNAESAMQWLGEGSVDLVVLDLCLPEMQGMEALKNIRSQFDKAALPMLVFSNPYLTNLGRTAVEAGASKCVPKAETSPAEVVALVRELLTPAHFLLAHPTSEAAVDESVATLAARGLSESQEEMPAALLINVPETLAKLRATHQAFAKAQEEEPSRAELCEMHRLVRLLAGSAAFLGFRKSAQMANALEALLIELQAKPKKITPSVIRTVAQAVDTLAFLFDQATNSQIELPTSPKILVVDDEIISRETICSALARAHLTAISLDDSEAAQHALEKDHFDLIFLDVEMPGQNGFELCVKIREMPTNRATPVVFVTAHSDFGSRAQSALSGGNDFIAKPFLLVELAVKALTCLFRRNPQASPRTTTERSQPRVTFAQQVSLA